MPLRGRGKNIYGSYELMLYTIFSWEEIVVLLKCGIGTAAISHYECDQQVEYLNIIRLHIYWPTGQCWPFWCGTCFKSDKYAMCYLFDSDNNAYFSLSQNLRQLIGYWPCRTLLSIIESQCFPAYLHWKTLFLWFLEKHNDFLYYNDDSYPPQSCILRLFSFDGVFARLWIKMTSVTEFSSGGEKYLVNNYCESSNVELCLLQ